MLCNILLLLSVLAYYPSYRALYLDFDIWFHLAYGRYFISNLTTTVDHSVFSWTPALADAAYNTWIGSSFLYLIHKALGVPGLFILLFAILFISGLIIFRLARMAGLSLNPSLFFIILLTAISIRSSANYIKPEMFSTFFMTIMTACYFRFRMTLNPWIILFLPAVFFVWVNTHGLWIFALFFLILVLATDLLMLLVRRNQAPDGKTIFYLATTVLLSILTVLLNPFGPDVTLNFFSLLFADASSMLSSITSGNNNGVLGDYRAIAEYQSMWPFLFLGSGAHFISVTAYALTLMITLFIVFWTFSWVRTGWADLPVATANISFYFMAMFMSRLSLVFGIIWVMSMIYLAWRLDGFFKLSRLQPFLLAAFLSLSAYSLIAAACIYQNPSWFGVNYRDYIPDKEVEYIISNNLPKPLFNDYLSGGYLLWSAYPEYKVFIDPRHFPYKDSVFPDYISIGTKYTLDSQGFDKFTSKYHFNSALIHRRYQELIGWFHQSPDWVLVYFDKVAVVMLRTDYVGQLSTEAREGSMRGPMHYKNVSNPLVLEHLFNVYINFVSLEMARQTRDIFEQNVSPLFWRKKAALDEFDSILMQRHSRH